MAQKQTRGNSKKKLNRVRVNVRRDYFNCRICEPWNSLPNDIVNASSVEVFKHMLFEYDRTLFLVTNIDTD